MVHKNNELIWKEKNTWIDSIPGILCEPDDPVLEGVVEDLMRHYSHIRTYHACKPTDFSSYAKKGILIASHDILKRRAIKRFCNNKSFVVDVDVVASAADKIKSLDNGKVYLGLDDRFLLDSCGHYLIYGSEYILAVANNLPQKYRKPCIELLKNTGRPTMIEISFPINLLSSSELSQLACFLCRYTHYNQRGDQIDFAVNFNDSIHPKYIVGSYHPSKIEDPLNNFNLYTYINF